MKTRIGCLHAHYSNIGYIEKELTDENVELVHFVDPGLMFRISSAGNQHFTGIQERVASQLEWISQSDVDAVLITCTNYIALLQGVQLPLTVPVIKIDEPFFGGVCDVEEPQILLFTNPATVAGTMERLDEYARRHGKSIKVEVRVIENTFDLIMQGNKEAYDTEISKYIQGLTLTNPNQVISVAQLSMVDAARHVEAEMNVRILNPLTALVTHMQSTVLEKNK
ncbi:hypothetical protein SD71_20260 [Cohnella kolymensis]|uniref:Asp/Glu racemase n=1 Tax=Cohnella kolymensis TaxID=1590652 RepID=A0ABR5A001_9BACL|nr:hypothetical protein [Cohnella kolymensis]KIL34366.1 hypothetical protein SD71_20260 [Cohnella kolymensis]